MNNSTPAINGHSLYSPSSASRYMACPGSVVLSQDIPDTVNEYAREGTAAHTLAEMILNGSVPNANDMLGEKIIWKEGDDTVSWVVTDDMVEYVQEYVDEIHRRVDDWYLYPGVSRVHLLVEQRVDFSDLVGVPGQGGTADIITEIHLDDGRLMLSVEDLKYGRGVVVEAEDNKQLMTYAAAAKDNYEMLGYEVVCVFVAIHQIRKNAFSETEYSAKQLDDFVVELREAVQSAEAQRNGDKPLELNPGEDQCRFCRAKASCKALRQEVASTVFVSTPLSVEDFDNMDVLEEMPPVRQDVIDDTAFNELLGSWLSKVGIIQQWCDAVQKEAFKRTKNGHKIPGYKLVEGRKGNASWVDETEAEKLLKSMRLKKTDIYNMKLNTPTKMRKILKSEPRRLKRIEDHIHRLDGSPTLVKDTDKRPALAFKTVSDGFDDLTESENLA